MTAVKFFMTEILSASTIPKPRCSFQRPNYFFIRPPEPSSAATELLLASLIVRIPQMPWMIAPAGGEDGWSLAAWAGAGCGHHSPQAWSPFTCPQNGSTAANRQRDSELSPDGEAAALPVAARGGSE